jgi:hypothetical protein
LQQIITTTSNASVACDLAVDCSEDLRDRILRGTIWDEDRPVTELVQRNSVNGSTPHCPSVDLRLEGRTEIRVKKEAGIHFALSRTEYPHASPKACTKALRHERGFSQSSLIGEKNIAREGRDTTSPLYEVVITQMCGFSEHQPALLQGGDA